MSLLPIGSLAVKIGYDLSPLDSLSSDIAGRLRSEGAGLSQLGQQLTMGLTAPIAAIGGAALLASGQMATAMANIGTLIPGQTARVNELNEEIQRLGPNLGIATGDLRDGAYQIISAFGDSADSIASLEINAKAARAGLATTSQAIALTSAVTKGFGDTSAEAQQKTADLAFATVRLGQTTFPELAAAIGKTVPLMKTLGGTEEELFGLFSTLTGVTGNTAEVGTQLKALQISFVTQSKGMTAALGELGYASSAAAIEELGLMGAIEKVIGTTNGSIESVGGLFSSSEALTAALALTGAQSDVAAEKIAAMGTAGGAATEAFEVATGGAAGFGFKLAQLRETARVAFEDLGTMLQAGLEPFLPIFSAVAKGISAAVTAFGNLPAPVKAAVGAVVGLLAAIGPVLGALGAWKAAAAVLGPVLAGLSVPIAPLVAGVAALAAGATLLYNNWDRIKAALSETGYIDVVKDALATAGEVLTGIWLKIAPIIELVLKDIYDLGRVWLGALLQVVQFTLGVIAAVWDRWGDEIKTIVRVVWDVIGTQFAVAFEIIGGLVRAGLKVIQGDWGGALNVMGQVTARVWTNIRNTTLRAIDAILGGIQRFVSAIPGIGAAVTHARGAIQAYLREQGALSFPGVSVGGGVSSGRVTGGATSSPGGVPDQPAAPTGGALGAPDADGTRSVGSEATKRKLQDVLDELRTDLANLDAEVALGLLNPLERAEKRVNLVSRAIQNGIPLGLRLGTDAAADLVTQLRAAELVVRDLSGLDAALTAISMKAQAGLVTPLEAAGERVAAIREEMDAVVERTGAGSQEVAALNAQLGEALAAVRDAGLDEALGNIGARLNATLLEPLEAVRAELDATKAALEDALVQTGGEATAETQRLVGEIINLRGELKGLEQDLADDKAWKTYTDGLALAQVRYDVLGDAQTLLNEKIQSTQGYLAYLLANGWDPNSEAVLRYKTELDNLVATKAGLLDLGQIVADVLNASIDGLVDSISDLASGSATLGEAAKGFLGGMLGTIGDIAIAEGKILLASGLGIEALKNSLISFTGVGAIAAGAGLIAIGMAAKSGMKALGGGGGGAGGTAVGSIAVNPNSRGGVGAAPSAAEALAAAEQRRSQEAPQTVKVELEGVTLPSGDIAFSMHEGTRRLDRYGTPLV